MKNPISLGPHDYGTMYILIYQQNVIVMYVLVIFAAVR